MHKIATFDDWIDYFRQWQTDIGYDPTLLGNYKFETKLGEYRGNLTRAAVELAKDWRTDRILRRLEALLAVANLEQSFVISGTGDVVEPEDGILAIGSGGPYALAAARALLGHSSLGARPVVEEALRIAGDIDIYTNQQIVIEELARG